MGVADQPRIGFVLAERSIHSTVSNHPFVVSRYAAFQSRSYLFFGVECCNGGDLQASLRQTGCLEEDCASKSLADIAPALGFVHHHHGNVFADRNGHVKLADFGASEFGLGKSEHVGEEKRSVGRCGRWW